MDDDWNKVMASKPVDKQAALVTARGVHWQPSKRLLPLILECPPIRPVPRAMTGQGHSDIRGQRFGRLMVIGLFDGPTQGRAQWVVRCDCGNYEVKRTVRLKKGSQICDRCHYLHDLISQQRRPCDIP